jgi:hypothetical protein
MKKPGSVGTWSRRVFVRIAAVTGLVILPAGAGAESSLSSSPEAILQAVEREGAAAVVVWLKNDPHEWKHVLGQIEQGSTPWLKVGRALQPGTEVGTRHPLDVALLSALPNNPGQVLRWIGQGVSLDDVCSVPRAEWDRAQIREYLARAKKSLKKPLPADIEPIRVQCIRQLDKVTARLQRQ